MSSDSSAIVSKVWNYPPSPFGLWLAGTHVLKNAGVDYGLPLRSRTQTGDYVEVRAARSFITYLLFLKLAPPSLKLRRAGSEMTELGFDPPSLRYGETGNPLPELQLAFLPCLTN